jgi:hypothetical protein
LQRFGDLADLCAQLAIKMGDAERLPQFVDELDGDRREIIDKI